MAECLNTQILNNPVCYAIVYDVHYPLGQSRYADNYCGFSENCNNPLNIYLTLSESKIDRITEQNRCIKLSCNDYNGQKQGKKYKKFIFFNELEQAAECTFVIILHLYRLLA